MAIPPTTATVIPHITAMAIRVIPMLRGLITVVITRGGITAGSRSSASPESQTLKEWIVQTGMRLN